VAKYEKNKIILRTETNSSNSAVITFGEEREREREREKERETEITWMMGAEGSTSPNSTTNMLVYAEISNSRN
jgi:hypothetical protein